MKPSISFIGAGKVGTALGVYFRKNNFEIGGYLSRTAPHAEQAAAATHSVSFTHLDELLQKSDVIWITTPDDAIATVAQRVAQAAASKKSEKLVVHASGVHNVDVLRVAQDAGYQTAAAHPLLAFNEVAKAVEMFPHTWFAVEEQGEKLRDLLHRCGNCTFEVDAEKKKLYHAAACILSNYMVTLLDVSQQLFAKAGLKETDVMRATLPLLESVVENLQNKSTKEALTGPIKRGDANSVRLHREALQQYAPRAAQLYQLLGQQTMQMIDDYKLKDILDKDF